MKKYLFLLLAVVLMSCQDDTDMGLPRTTMGIAFYSPDYQRMTVDSLTVIAIGVQSDSVLYDRYSGQRISLPLRYVGEETQFVLRRGTRLPDTLTVRHKNTPHFLSMEAGYTMYYDLQALHTTTNAIDTAIILNPSVIAGEQENISVQYPLY